MILDWIIPNLPNVFRRPQQMFNNALILFYFTAVSVFDELMCELFSSWGFHFSWCWSTLTVRHRGHLIANCSDFNWALKLSCQSSLMNEMGRILHASWGTHRHHWIQRALTQVGEGIFIEQVCKINSVCGNSWDWIWYVWTKHFHYIIFWFAFLLVCNLVDSCMRSSLTRWQRAPNEPGMFRRAQVFLVPWVWFHCRFPCASTIIYFWFLDQYPPWTISSLSLTQPQSDFLSACSLFFPFRFYTKPFSSSPNSARSCSLADELHNTKHTCFHLFLCCCANTVMFLKGRFRILDSHGAWFPS